MQTDYVVKDIDIILQHYEDFSYPRLGKHICLFQRIEMPLVSIFVAMKGVMPEVRVLLIANIGVGANWLEAH